MKIKKNFAKWNETTFPWLPPDLHFIGDLISVGELSLVGGQGQGFLPKKRDLTIMVSLSH